MNSRKKEEILFLLFELADGPLSKLYIQKILFLAWRKKDDLVPWGFVPYRYGPYSFSLARYIENHPLFIVEKNQVFCKGSLQEKRDSFFDLKLTLSEIIERFPPEETNRLLDYVYDRYMSRTSFHIGTKKVRERSADFFVFTIGYEGLEIEDFVALLLKYEIEELVDVRARPYSRKFGFSRNFLERKLPFWGIKYRSVPVLGIPAEIRRRMDLDGAFDWYRQNLRTRLCDSIEMRQLYGIVSSKRVALLCFERDPMRCHRSILSEFVAERTGVKVEDIPVERSFDVWGD